MKKLLLWIVVLVLSISMVAAFSLYGCKPAEEAAAPAEEEVAEEEAPAEEAPAEEAESDFFVAYIAKNTVDVFHQTLNTAAQIALDALVANGEIGSWQLYDGLTDPVTQVNLVEDAINMGADLVIVLPAEAAGSAPVVSRCAEENIPCIVVNSTTENTSELATAYVGSDDVQAGEMMAKFVQEQLPDGGGYGHIQGVLGNSAQISRGEGIHNILDSDEKWTLLDGCEQTGEWQAEKAVKFAEDWLAKYGEELNAIICDNDDMSSAVQTSMNTAGRSDIVCIGVDGNKGPMTMVQNGELLATILQDGAAQVTTAIELGNKVLHGEEVAKETMIDFVLITIDNVGQYLK
ncbi:MAG: substrate-binding domain-containing protein [Candidatus Hydromicrobium sp.]|nr:substrate-binding domain-containing protein [Candidatus Hydromicrobium sp.]